MKINMVYLEMAGRLGNQLFRYSFARRVSLLCDEKLIIDFKRVYKNNGAGWGNSLKLFNTDNYIETNNSKFRDFYCKASFMQIILYVFYKVISKLLKRKKGFLQKFQLKMQPVLNRNNLYFLELGYYNYDFSYLKKNKVKYICGCFECSKYFNDIEDIIRKEITPKKIISKNNDLMRKISTTNSVCVTIRRGDFVTNEINKKIYDICDANYFESAIKIMKEKLDNPTFFIFSDDVEWAKNNINFQGAKFYSETGNDTVDEKLRLMSSCKHFIISNSTFSWWAQYLSSNKDKIVISPNIWYKNDMESDLIEDSWIKIDVLQNKD